MVLGVVGPDDPDPVEILAGVAVNDICEPLDPAVPDSGEVQGTHHHEEQHRHTGSGHQGPFNGRTGDFQKSPYRNDGGLYHSLKSPGDEVLHLGYIVRGTGDETGGGETVDIVHGEGLNSIELHQAHIASRQSGKVRQDEAGDKRDNQTRKGENEHLGTLLHDDIGMVEDDLVGDIPHVLGDLEVHPDLEQDKHHGGGDKTNSAPTENPSYHCTHQTYIRLSPEIIRLMYCIKS